MDKETVWTDLEVLHGGRSCGTETPPSAVTPPPQVRPVAAGSRPPAPLLTTAGSPVPGPVVRLPRWLLLLEVLGKAQVPAWKQLVSGDAEGETRRLEDGKHGGGAER